MSASYMIYNTPPLYLFFTWAWSVSDFYPHPLQLAPALTFYRRRGPLIPCLGVCADILSPIAPEFLPSLFFCPGVCTWWSVRKGSRQGGLELPNRCLSPYHCFRALSLALSFLHPLSLSRMPPSGEIFHLASDLTPSLSLFLSLCLPSLSFTIYTNAQRNMHSGIHTSFWAGRHP